MGHSVARSSGSSLGVLGILVRRRAGQICRVEPVVANGIFGDRSLLWGGWDVRCRLWCFSRHRAEVVPGLTVGIKTVGDGLSPVALCRVTRFWRQIALFEGGSRLVVGGYAVS